MIHIRFVITALISLLGLWGNSSANALYGDGPCTYTSVRNETYNGGLAYYNGSKRIPFDGFRPPGASASRWVLSTAVLYDNVTLAAQNSSTVRQNFWIDTIPVQNLSSPDIGYTGAVFALTAFVMPAITTSPHYNNTCDGIFSTSCMAAIQNAAYAAAINMSGSGAPSANDTGTAQMESILTQLSAANIGACGDNSWQITYQNYILGNPYAVGTPYSSDPTAPCSTNIGNGSRIGGGIMQLQAGLISSGLWNNTLYDGVITESTPILLVVWSNTGKGAAAWADTRLLCLTPDFINTGSRTPPASSDGNMIYVSWTVMVSAVLAAAMVWGV